jgi:hypothetical protein
MRLPRRRICLDAYATGARLRSADRKSRLAGLLLLCRGGAVGQTAGLHQFIPPMQRVRVRQQLPVVRA